MQMCLVQKKKKITKGIKSPSSVQLQDHLWGFLSKLSKDASPFFFFFFFLQTTEGKGNA